MAKKTRWSIVRLHLLDEDGRLLGIAYTTGFWFTVTKNGSRGREGEAGTLTAAKRELLKAVRNG